ncbi:MULTISPECIES: UvrD-helicase domain-containing protein [Methanoculleus]|uniref:DNA 3'-5' helicase n=2 Tax=Methanoculleus TaxID=45989 RepID=A3CVM7_METMJ|nr:MULTISPECIES: UvrD-helicase domain-containing protein [Methanoculleus]ABN57427.1 UvrD/REP helicase [Methanoculleus marisnigri JR1]UYU18832.1 UvrD-helicase domain-containing protein [Methanoculleus submarinus]
MGLTERQARAALDHSTSKCVTAGAGTGKTHVLVQKYLSLLESGVGVGNILALTFTEKAAGEMKIRVRRAIAEKEGERWDAIRDEFLWAKVSTFHSFCASVLREFSIGAGVGPSFAVLDEGEAFRLREEAIDDLIHGDPPTACRDAVIGALRAVGAYELKNYLEALYSRRGAAEAFFAALAESEEEVLDAWRTALERCQTEALEAFLSRAAPSIETLRDLAARYPGERDPAGAYLRAVEPCLAGEIAVAELAAVHDNSGFRKNMGQKKNWEGDDLDNLRAAYGVLRQCLTDHAGACSLTLDAADPFTRATLDFLRDLGVVFKAFLDSVEAEKRRMNALDFDDLVNRTHRLFRDRGDIVETHFRSRFRFILVDEFQDTDPVQIAIIRTLLGDSANLFVVGDPKQSIYLFREADVTQFSHTRDLIERDLGGETVALDVNFRSTPEVVGFTNAVFSALMAEAGRPWEFLYEPLHAFRRDDAGSVELLLCQKIRDRAAGRRAEAEMAARKIRSLVERGEKRVSRDGEVRPAGYGDVAVLLERRTNLAYYEWALARYGVPYHVHAGLGFYERQEVYDLYNILRFLANNLDDAALYGVLRSPYFGFSDARLFHIARAPGASLWERLQAAAEPAAATLREWLSLSRRLPPARLLRRIVDESGIFVVFGGMAGGEQAAANVEKLIALARDADCSTLAGFVAELGRSIDAGDREGDAPLDLASADSVSIMTVHAAKGLEFPVVVVPDLAETPRSGGGTIMVEDGLLLGVSIPNPANDHEREETPVLRLLKDEYRQKEEAERKRLFYVAVTRAEDHLILCGEMPVAVPESLRDARTRMAWLAHCLGLCDEVYARGEAVLGTLRIPITLDPAAIPVDVQETVPVCLPVPDDVPAAPVPAGIPSNGKKERVYSASELEAYLRGPAESRLPVFAAGEDALTRGLVVHEVFRGRDPAAVLRRYGLDPAGAVEYQELYVRFLASPLMRGIVRDHREVPFSARVNGFAFRGVIDRLVQRVNGTWMLIDYKTGTPGDAGEYAIQMAVYHRAAAQILSAPVTPYLYFVDADRWAEIEVDEDLVFAEISRAISGIEEEGL